MWMKRLGFRILRMLLLAKCRCMKDIIVARYRFRIFTFALMEIWQVELAVAELDGNFAEVVCCKRQQILDVPALLRRIEV